MPTTLAIKKASNSTSTKRKQERIECRVTREQKDTILEAAKMDNLSISDFMMKCSLDAAQKLFLREQQSFVISEEDWPKLFREKRSEEENARIAAARARFKECGIDYEKQGFD